jgi:hypothetical protein
MYVHMDIYCERETKNYVCTQRKVQIYIYILLVSKFKFVGGGEGRRERDIDARRET